MGVRWGRLIDLGTYFPYAYAMGEALKPDDPRLSYFLLVLPVAHLLLSSLFMWGYTAGFGAGLSSFVSASDLFTTSIRDMIRGYLSAIIPWVVVMFFRYTADYPFMSDRIAAMPEGEIKTKAEKRHNVVRNCIVIGAMMFDSGVMIYHVWLTSNELPLNYFLINVALSLTGMIILLEIQHRWKLTNLVSELSILLFFLAVSATTTGASSGQKDRLNDGLWNQDLIRCGQYSVLRSLSDFYLAVDKQGARALIDKDCVVKFTIPPSSTVKETGKPAPQPVPPQAKPYNPPVAKPQALPSGGSAQPTR